MTDDSTGQDNGYLGQTTEIVAAYLGNNTVKVGDIARHNPVSARLSCDTRYRRGRGPAEIGARGTHQEVCHSQLRRLFRGREETEGAATTPVCRARPDAC